MVKLKGLIPDRYVRHGARHTQRPDANAGSSPVRYARHSDSLCFREIEAKMVGQQNSQRQAVRQRGLLGTPSAKYRDVTIHHIDPTFGRYGARQNPIDEPRGWMGCREMVGHFEIDRI